jgi:hypothetical protein
MWLSCQGILLLPEMQGLEKRKILGSKIRIKRISKADRTRLMAAGFFFIPCRQQLTLPYI